MRKAEIRTTELAAPVDYIAPGEPLSTPDDIMTSEQAAEFLNVSTNTLAKYTSGRLIPHYKPTGGKLFFSKVELCRWIAKGRVPTMEECARIARRL